MQQWSPDQVKDMSGQIVVVTGGNSGLGYEEVKFLSSKGATVVLACRDINKGQQARAEILEQNQSGRIVVMALDLADLQSIQNFGFEFNQRYERLDILINNAGVMAIPYQRTKDDFEMQMGVNHLGHFALTGLLFPVLKQTPNARIVNVSSIAHNWGTIDFDNMMFDDAKGYTPMKAYGRSKLANLLFTYELSDRVTKADLDIKVVVAHPGGAGTNLGRSLINNRWYRLIRPVVKASIQSPYMGALAIIRAATDEQAETGNYYGPDGFRQIKGQPILVESNRLSHLKSLRVKFFNWSEQLTQVPFDFD